MPDETRFIEHGENISIAYDQTPSTRHRHVITASRDIKKDIEAIRESIDSLDTYMRLEIRNLQLDNKDIRKAVRDNSELLRRMNSNSANQQL